MAKLNAEDIVQLGKSPLFANTASDQLESVLGCLQARVVEYDKGDTIFRPGQVITYVGVVTHGAVIISMQDYWGNRNILSRVGQGHIFGEAFACSPKIPLTVGVEADGPVRVVFLDVRRIITTCSSTCDYHIDIIRSLLTILSQKNLFLTQKTNHITKRTTREKVLSYLSAESQSAGSNEFDIPFNRQQLADYLSVERSALSTCLGKLQDEGLIEFRRNRFKLL